MVGYLYTGVTRDMFLWIVRELGFPNELCRELEHAITEDPNAAWRVHLPLGDIRWSPEGLLGVEGEYDIKTWVDVVLLQEGVEYEV